MVLRDYRNTFRAVQCYAFNNVSSAEHVELVACRRGVQMASKLGLTRAVIETDNQGFARALCLEQLDPSMFRSPIQENKDFLWLTLVIFE